MKASVVAMSASNLLWPCGSCLDMLPFGDVGAVFRQKALRFVLEKVFHSSLLPFLVFL